MDHADATGAGEAPSAAAFHPSWGTALDYTPQHLAKRILAARGVLQGERKRVTALFVDVVGSTSLAERIGAEEMAGVVDRLFGLCLEAVHRHEGTVTQFLGDGFLALFGAPLAYENHAERGVRTAWEIQRRLATTQIIPADVQGFELRLRMGLNSGPVIVGRIGDSLRMDYTAVGDTVNLAARLQALAEPGAIYLSEATRDAVGPGLLAELIGERTVKGRAQPVRVYRVERVRTPRRASPATSTSGIGSPLVGREDEYTVFERALGRLRDGRGGLVLVTGEAGVGKSRLVVEARQLVAAEDVQWLEGRTLSFGRGISYWPFLEILRDLCDITDDDGEPQGWAKLAARMEALFGIEQVEVLPYLATMMGLTVRGELQERVRYLDGRSMGAQIHRSLRKLLERLAAERPQALVFEDLHWADASSLELLEHLLPLADRMAVLFICLSRPEDDGPLPRLRDLARRQSTVTLFDIQLAALRPAEAEALLDNLVGGPLDPHSGAVLLRRAEGNPFFLEELVRSLIALGGLEQAGDGRWRAAGPLDEGTIPETVQGVIMARVDRLEQDLKELLRVASVVGRVFLSRVLEAVHEAQKDLDQELSDLVEVELIRERRRLPELEYIFKHALVQEATYDSVLLQRRRELHRRVAECIEGLFADRLDEFFGVIAHHYAQAEDWDKVQAYLLKAGDEAGRIAADTEALAYYRGAMDAYARVFGQGWDPVLRARLERRIGEALFRLGHHVEAYEHIHRSFEYVGRSYPRTRRALASATLREGIRQLGHRLRPGSHYPPAETAGDATAIERFQSYNTLAWMDYFEDPSRFIYDTVASLNLAERHGTPDVVATGCAFLGFVLAHVPLHRAADRYFARAISLAAASGNPVAVGDANLFPGLHAQFRGRWDLALDLHARAERAYWEGGHLRGWGTAVVQQAWIYQLRGHFAGTIAEMERIGRVGQETSEDELVAWDIQGRANTLWRMGRIDAAVELLETVIPLYRAIPSTINVIFATTDLAECRRRQGRPEEARALLQESRRLMEERGFRGFAVVLMPLIWAQLHLDLADAACGGERKEALREARWGCRAAAKHSRIAMQGVPGALRVRGTYEWLGGHTGRARRAWQRSAEHARALGARYDLALTELEAGRRLGDARRVELAMEMLAHIGGSPHVVAGPADRSG
jgi:class 3 adenylate cyclase/tetratricopeptide (TPR) repeat protein